jgi:hypothetical protein
MRLTFALTTFTLNFVFSIAVASGLEITQGPLPGEITLNYSGKTKTYEDITGEKDGVYRSITTVDKSPALFSGLSDQTYHTLIVKDSEIFVDCIYSRLRSNITGVRIARGVCGLNEKLTSNYAEEAYKYTNTWLEDAARIKISSLINNKKPLTLHENTKHAIELYEIYNDAASLEGAKPVSVIKSGDFCYALNGATPYLIYDKHNLDQIVEIQAFEDDELTSIHTVDKTYLEELDKTKCPEAK